MSHANKAGRNDACPCGSGKKFKRCCEPKQHSQRGSRALVVVVLAVIVGALGAAIVSFSNDRGYAAAAPGRVWSQEHGHYH
jgi:hypothetical protein